MTKKPTRAEKTKANRGVRLRVLELLKIYGEDRPTASDLLENVQTKFPHADIKTVSNCLTILLREHKVLKHPGVKGKRGNRWQYAPATAAAFEVGKDKEKPKPEPQFNAKQVGEAVIRAIQNMAKRIKEMDERIDRLLNTLSNRQATWDGKERELRDKIVDQTKIIASLEAQLAPDPDLMFKLSEVANFTGEQDGKT
ncbi:MAG: hypothetical protein ACXABY_06505 [Candidatus Thorarchaeota archaeon]|jgi:hypothetical protein